jgi:gas vesicle protein
MKKLLGLLLGFIVGALIGATLVVLLSPVSGEELIQNIKKGYADSLEEARRVSAERRAHMEAELERLRKAS